MLKPANNKVDVNALKALLEETGMNNREISEKLGYGRGQISTVISRGVISKPVIVALENVFGIKYEDYEPKQKKEPDTNAANAFNGNDYSELTKWLSSEIKQAVQEAFNAAGFASVNRR